MCNDPATTGTAWPASEGTERSLDERGRLGGSAAASRLCIQIGRKTFHRDISLDWSIP